MDKHSKRIRGFSRGAMIKRNSKMRNTLLMLIVAVAVLMMSCQVRWKKYEKIYQRA